MVEEKKSPVFSLKKKEEIVNKPTTLFALLQKQVEHEFHNERLYLSMAIWCNIKGYVETAKFFSTHALEERKHGMDFLNFMLNQRLPVETPIVTDVPTEFSDLTAVLTKALEREKLTSKMIAELHRDAISNASLASQVTTKYIAEQVEEEELFQSILNLHELCNGNKIDFEMEIGAVKSSGKYTVTI